MERPLFPREFHPEWDLNPEENAFAEKGMKEAERKNPLPTESNCMLREWKYAK